MSVIYYRYIFLIHICIMSTHSIWQELYTTATSAAWHILNTAREQGLYVYVQVKYTNTMRLSWWRLTTVFICDFDAVGRTFVAMIVDCYIVVVCVCGWIDTCGDGGRRHERSLHRGCKGNTAQSFKLNSIFILL